MSSQSRDLRFRIAVGLVWLAILLVLAFIRTVLRSPWFNAAGCRDRASAAVLHRAVLRADLATVRSIVERDPGCVNATDRAGMTALHFTAVRLRVSPFASRRSGVSGADMACMSQASLTSYDLEDLRKRGPGSKDLITSTTIDYAPFAELLISHGANVKARDRSLSRTPLHLAMGLGHKHVAEVLLAHGADINAADVHGLTALDITAMNGNLAMAQLALEHGADANAKVSAPLGLARLFRIAPFEGDTPLALATICNRLQMVEFLLAHGADPNVKLGEGFTLLQMASSPEIVKVLLAHGARSEGRGYEERTPLWQAVMQGRTDVAQLLLSRGADIEAKDKNGNTPLLVALTSPDLRREQMVRLLLSHHAQVNVRGPDGNSPLHLAARHGGSRIVSMLLDAGAEVNAGNRYGLTPLHLAVKENDLGLVELLLARGALVNARDGQGRTPLYYTWGGSAQDKKIAEILSSHGAVKQEE